MGHVSVVHRSEPIDSNVSRINIAIVLHAQWPMAHCYIDASFAAVALGLIW